MGRFCSRLLLFAAVLSTAACSPDTSTVQSGRAQVDPPGGNSARQAPQQPESKADIDPTTERIMVSTDTTFLTEPLTEDGRVDYVTALNARMRRGVTAENNAAVLYWQALGPNAIDEEVRGPYFEQLRGETLPDEGEYFVSLADFVRRRSTGCDPRLIQEPFDTRQVIAERRPWSETEFPFVAAWLRKNETALRLVADGSRRDRYYSPLVAAGHPQSLHRGAVSRLSPLRKVARALRARAMLHVAGDNVQAAWCDLDVCHRLARHLASDSVLSDYLVASGIEGSTLNCEIAIAQHAGLSGKQVQSRQREIAALPPMATMAETTRLCERCYVLDYLSHLIRQRSQKEIEKPAPLMPTRVIAAVRDETRPVEWNHMLRMANAHYEAVDQVFADANVVERLGLILPIENSLENTLRSMGRENPDDDLAPVLAAIDTPKKRAELIGGEFLRYVTTAWAAMLRSQNRLVDHQQLTAVALALAEYHADHREYPRQLAELSPEYLESIPLDRYTGQVLSYERIGLSYLLRGVGPDGKRDGSLILDDMVVFDWKAFRDAASVIKQLNPVVDFSEDFGGFVKSIDMCKTKATDADVASLGLLASAPEYYVDDELAVDTGLPYLRGIRSTFELRLGGTRITDVALAHVSQLPNLIWLDLSATRITNEGLRQLRALSQLESLNLLDTRVSDEAIADLQRALPGCDILH